MGQRVGFASTDIAKINKMYQCDNQPINPSIERPTIERPTIQRPTGGISGGGSGQFTNPVAQAVSNIGNFFSFLGGRPIRQDEIDDGTNDLSDE